MPEIYNVSFRCFFPGSDETRYSTHYQPLPLTDIPRWLDAYRFTHPNCISITAKVWFTDQPSVPDCCD